MPPVTAAAAVAVPLKIVQDAPVELETGGAGTNVEVDVCLFTPVRGYLSIRP